MPASEHSGFSKLSWFHQHPHPLNPPFHSPTNFYKRTKTSTSQPTCHSHSLLSYIYELLQEHVPHITETNHLYQRTKYLRPQRIPCHQKHQNHIQTFNINLGAGCLSEVCRFLEQGSEGYKANKGHNKQNTANDTSER